MLPIGNGKFTRLKVREREEEEVKLKRANRKRGREEQPIYTLFVVFCPRRMVVS